MQVVTRADSQSMPKVRLVTEGGNEIVSLDKALAAAEDQGLDLVCVSPDADPPVCKVDDFKKLRYESKKQKHKRPRTQAVKEIQVKVNISDHDLGTKLRAIEKFLERGDKVKLSVYAHLRGLLSHGWSPFRSCPHLVLVPFRIYIW